VRPLGFACLLTVLLISGLSDHDELRDHLGGVTLLSRQQVPIDSRGEAGVRVTEPLSDDVHRHAGRWQERCVTVGLLSG